jgi:hypothetical protein
MEAHQAAIIEIPGQSDRTGSPRYQIPNKADARLQELSAATTIAGIELLRRIRKEHFTLGRLRLKNQTVPAIWNAVLAA